MSASAAWPVSSAREPLGYPLPLAHLKNRRGYPSRRRPLQLPLARGRREMLVVERVKNATVANLRIHRRTGGGLTDEARFTAME